MIVLTIIVGVVLITLYPILRYHYRVIRAKQMFEKAHKACFSTVINGGEQAYELALEADRILPENPPPDIAAPIWQLIFELAARTGKPSYGKAKSWMLVAEDPGNPSPYVLHEVTFFEALCIHISDLTEDPDLMESMVNVTFNRLKDEPGTACYIQDLLTYSCTGLVHAKEYQRVIRLAADRATSYPEPALLEALARSFLNTGNLRRALHFATISVEELEKTDSGEKDLTYYVQYSMALRTLGLAQLESGKAEAACDTLQKSMLAFPPDSINPNLVELAEGFLTAGQITAVSSCVTWLDDHKELLLGGTSDVVRRDYIRTYYDYEVAWLHARLHEASLAQGGDAGSNR